VATEVTPVIEKVWKPFSRQEDFIGLPDGIFEGFYGGAAGGGKSDVITMLPILRQFHENPNYHGIVFRRTFPELEESLLMVARKWYPYFGAKYNDQKHSWTFPSGAVQRFSYLQTDEDARSHDTAQYHYIGFDELTHFTEFQYTYMISRIRRATKELPVIIRSASNPGNVGHSWVRSRFVAPFRQGYKALYDKISDTYRIFIPSKATDNPHIMENDPNYINRLRLLPLVEQKAKIEGDWWAYAGQVFFEFRSQKYPDEPENAIHICPWFKVPGWWPKFIAIDWGFSAKTVVYWMAVSPDGRLYVYREYDCTKRATQIWAADILRATQYDGNVQFAVLDPSGWQNRGEEKLIWMQVQEALGDIPVRQADNDRVGGKLAIHEVLRWDPRPPRYVPKEGFMRETYEQIFRMSGLRAAMEYQEMFAPDKPELNLPKLQILENTCPLLVDVLPQCVYADASREGKPAEDVKEFVGDDAYDSFRYGVKAYESLVAESSQVSEELRKQSERLKLAETDMYSFYRRMEQAEKDQGSDVVYRPRQRRF
jgi:hypothetical protein